MSENTKKLSRNKNVVNAINSFTPISLRPHLSFSIGLLSKFRTSNKVNNKKSPFKSIIIARNLRKYSVSNEEYNKMKINDLVDSKGSHLIAIFKDFLIIDYIYEFLNRKYSIKESLKRIPELGNYYKNYFTFFCKPCFRNLYCNEIIQSHGEAKAELYYNKNFEKNEKKKKEINDEQVLFNSFIKEAIDNNSFMTYKDNEDNKNKTLELNDTSKLIDNKFSIESSFVNMLNCFDIINNKSKPLKGNKIQKNGNIKHFSDNLKLKQKNIFLKIEENEFIFHDRTNSPKINKKNQGKLKRGRESKFNEFENKISIQSTRNKNNFFLDKFDNIKNNYLSIHPRTITGSISNRNNTLGNPKSLKVTKTQTSEGISKKISNPIIKQLKFKSSSFHIKSMSSNFLSSIKAYNKSLKQISYSISNSKKNSKFSSNRTSFNSLNFSHKPKHSINIPNLMQLTLRFCKTNQKNQKSSNSKSKNLPQTSKIKKLNLKITNNIFSSNSSNSNSNESNPTSASNSNKVNLQCRLETNQNLSRNKQKPLMQSNTEIALKRDIYNTLKKGNNNSIIINKFLRSYAGKPEGKPKKLCGEKVTNKDIHYKHQSKVNKETINYIFQQKKNKESKNRPNSKMKYK